VIIVCVNCDKPIYDCAAVGRDFTGARVVAEDFTPLDPSHAMPRDGLKMSCPLCGEGFAFNDDGTCLLRLESGAWWPHPPIRSPQNSIDNQS